MPAVLPTLTYIPHEYAPILVHGDPIGSVMLLSKEKGAKMGEIEEKLVKTACVFLSRQMES
jgi:AbrB family transcriptional regulator (stage V sporulation protein T)